MSPACLAGSSCESPAMTRKRRSRNQVYSIYLSAPVWFWLVGPVDDQRHRTELPRTLAVADPLSGASAPQPPSLRGELLSIAAAEISFASLISLVGNAWAAVVSQPTSAVARPLRATCGRALGVPCWIWSDFHSRPSASPIPETARLWSEFRGPSCRRPSPCRAWRRCPR